MDTRVAWCVAALAVVVAPAAGEALPDLVVVSVSGPASAPAGGGIAVTDTVRSDGAGTGSFYVGYYLSTDAVITTADRSMGWRQLSLAAGQSSTATTNLTVPVGLGGPYYLGVIVDGDS